MTPTRHPASWTIVSLEAVAAVVRGVTFPATAKQRKRGVGLVRCLRTSNVQDELETDDVLYVSKEFVRREDQWLKPNDIIISMANSYELVGKVAFAATVTEPTTFGGFIAAIRARYVHPKFLMHQLRSPSARTALRAGASQTVNIANISLSTLNPLPLSLPPEREQQRIVDALDSYLSRLDAAGASLDRVQTKLKTYRASVLKAAVEGRLVPTEAEVARQEKRDYEPAQVLLARILKERRRRWEEAELTRLTKAGKAPKDDKWKGKYRELQKGNADDLPILPDGWSWASVESLTTKVVDGVHKKPTYVDEGVPFVTVKNLTAGPGISFDSLKYVSEKDHAEFCRRANPEDGDILVTKDGTLGVVRQVRTTRAFSIFVSVALVKPVLRATSNFIEIALASPVVQQQMVPKGSGLQHIHLEDLRADMIPLPPLAEQERIVEAVQRQLAVVEHVAEDVSRQRTRIARLRQAVLKWAFEGRLVDQDPSDEPDEQLLARVQAERTSTEPMNKKKPRGRKAKAA